jgi:hypothetical protein
MYKNNNHHWPQLSNALQKYDIVDDIDLIALCLDTNQIGEELSKYKNFVFKPNQRLILTHIDIAFYLEGSSYSINLYNLYLIIVYYDIPTEHLILITNQDVRSEIKILSKIFDVSPIKTIVSFYNTVQTVLPDEIFETSLDHDIINYPFACLNGLQRTARLALLCELQEKNLIEKGIVSWNFHPSDYNNVLKKSNYKFEINLPIISTNDHFGNEMLLFNTNQKLNFKKYSHIFFNQTYKHPLIYGRPNGKETRWQPKFLKNALVYLVSETTCNYPYPYLSEKTFKGFLVKRPMIILGAKNSIFKIKELGFKTWDNFWDESYDSIDTFSDRLDAIIKIIDNLSKKSSKELREICVEMQNIVEYNYDWYLNGFAKKSLNEFIKNIDV